MFPFPFGLYCSACFGSLCPSFVHVYIYIYIYIYTYKELCMNPHTEMIYHAEFSRSSFANYLTIKPVHNNWNTPLSIARNFHETWANSIALHSQFLLQAYKLWSLADIWTHNLRNHSSYPIPSPVSTYIYFKMRKENKKRQREIRDRIGHFGWGLLPPPPLESSLYKVVMYWVAPSMYWNRPYLWLH